MKIERIDLWLVRLPLVRFFETSFARSFASVKEAVDAFNREAPGGTDEPDIAAAGPDATSQPIT